MTKKYYVEILAITDIDTVKLQSDTFDTIQEAMAFKSYLEANLDRKKFIVNIGETLDKAEMFKELMENLKEAREEAETRGYNS